MEVQEENENLQQKPAALTVLVSRTIVCLQYYKSRAVSKLACCVLQHIIYWACIHKCPCAVHACVIVQTSSYCLHFVFSISDSVTSIAQAYYNTCSSHMFGRYIAQL